MNNSHGLRVKAENAPWNRCVDFFLYTNGDGEKLRVATQPELAEVQETAYVTPTFSLANEQAQALMDELWACGFRPSEGTGSAGALAATQKHLDDMRKIAFDLLGKQP